MHYRTHWATLIGTAAMLLTADALAESIRCGQKLATRGDSLYQVRAVCGEPDATDRRIEVRKIRRHVSGPCFKGDDGRTRCGHVQEQAVEVVIDEWTYDFGKRRFLHYVTFEDGRLVHVRTGSYGYKD